MGKESKENAGGSVEGQQAQRQPSKDSEVAADAATAAQTGSRKKRRNRGNQSLGSSSPQQDGEEGLVIHVDGHGQAGAHAEDNTVHQQPEAGAKDFAARPAPHTAPAAVGKAKPKTAVLAGSIILIDDTRELTQDADIAKLIRPPRYFDDDDDGSLVAITHRCFNCGQIGHRSIECTNAARLKPCHLCAHLGHEGRDCPNRLCFKCGQPGHMSRECKSGRQEGWEAATMQCNRCGSETCPCVGKGDYFRYEGGCSQSYSKSDLAYCRCYVCGKAGHLCCRPPPIDTVATISCYFCGEEGHYGEECTLENRPHLAAERAGDMQRAQQEREAELARLALQRQWMDRGGGPRGGYDDGRGPYGGAGDRAGGHRFASTGRGPGDDPLFPRGGGGGNSYGREVSRFGRERELDWEAERRREWDRERPMERGGRQHKRWDEVDDDAVDAGMARWNQDQGRGRGGGGVQRWGDAGGGGGQQRAPYHQSDMQYTMMHQQQQQQQQYGMYNAGGVTYAVQASMGAVTAMQQQGSPLVNPYSAAGGPGRGLYSQQQQQPMYRESEARQNPYAQYVPNGQYGSSTGTGGGRYASTGASGSSRHTEEYGGGRHQRSSSAGHQQRGYEDRSHHHHQHHHHDSRSRSPSRGHKRGRSYEDDGEDDYYDRGGGGGGSRSRNDSRHRSHSHNSSHHNQQHSGRSTGSGHKHRR